MYQQLKDELKKTISIDAEKEIASRAAKFLNEKYPKFYKNGQKVKGVTFLSDKLQQPKPALSDKEKLRIENTKKFNLKRRQEKNKQVLIPKEGDYPIKYFDGYIALPQMITWVDSDRIIYRDYAYDEENKYVDKEAYELILFNTKTGISNKLTDISGKSSYAFDIEKQQIYYYQAFGSGEVLKLATLKEGQLIAQETNEETPKNYNKFSNRGQRQKTKSGGKLDRCFYYDDLYEDLEKLNSGAGMYYFCHVVNRNKTAILKKAATGSVSLDGCRVFGATRKRRETVPTRFVIDLCKE